MLNELEPYRHSTREEVMSLYEKGIISKEELRLKTDFSRFIRRFERENDNIIEFGANLSHYAKISTIYKTLLSYAREGIENPS